MCPIVLNTRRSYLFFTLVSGANIAFEIVNLIFYSLRPQGPMLILPNLTCDQIIRFIYEEKLNSYLNQI